MALRFRTRLSITISALVFLVVAVMTVVILAIFGIDMWRTNWEAGTVMTQVTTASVQSSASLPGHVEGLLQDQMQIQARLLAELADATHSGAPSSPSLAERLEGVLSDGESGHIVIDELQIRDSAGRVAERVRRDPRTGDDGVEGISAEAPLRNHLGVAQVSMASSSVQQALAPLELGKMLEHFMAAGQYTRMAIVAPDGSFLARMDRADVNSTPQSDRTMVRFCVDFLDTLEDDSVERFNTKFVERDVGVVTPILVENRDEPLALYIEHDTSDMWEYILNRLGALVTVGFAMFIFAMIVSIFLSRGLSKPLIELARGAREFGAGNLNYRLRLRRKDEFNDLAQSFNTMAISIQEYVHELRQETARRERLESEFRIAAEMQQALLPEAPPKVEGLKLLGWSRPSKEVGGDFYDYFEMPNGSVAVVLGDATGKGVSAALMSTQCSSILRTLADQDLTCSELLRQTNNEMYKRIASTHRFVTLFLCIIDPDSGEVQYGSAGHPPPFLVNSDSGESRWLESKSGYPMGIVKDAQFTETHCRLQPRDTVFIYSDGLTDAQNDAKELYGDERLGESIRTYARGSAEDLLAGVRDDVTRHMAGKEPFDDMTVAIARFRPRTP